LRLREVLEIENLRLLELEPEVVAFARALAHAGEHGNAAVVLGQVVDELLNDDGLAHAGAAEQADLAAAQVGLDEGDDLDPGVEHLEPPRLSRAGRRRGRGASREPRRRARGGGGDSAWWWSRCPSRPRARRSR